MESLQVDVDVYRRLGNVRHEPLPGSSSFFQVGEVRFATLMPCSSADVPHHTLLSLQEQVAECRELNSTEVWLAVASTVNPLCQSMPLLLHHQVSSVRVCTIAW